MYKGDKAIVGLYKGETPIIDLYKGEVQLGANLNYIIPTAFTWQDAPINIKRTSTGFTTDFDVATYKNAGGTTYYVDKTNGSDTANNGLTRETAYKTISKAYTVAINNDTIFIIGGGTFYRGENWGDIKLTKSINLIAEDKVSITQGNLVSYSKEATATNVYKAARSAVVDVVDISGTDPVFLSKVTSIAECDATANTWYTDGTSLYVHNSDGTAPTEDIINILALNVACVHFDCDTAAQNLKVYIENVDFYGGYGAVIAQNTATYTEPEFYSKNCGFYKSKHYATTTDAAMITGCKYSYHQNSDASLSPKDGFNYGAQNGVATKFIEVDCSGRDNGLAGIFTSNGSTSHAACKGIRLNGTYYHNYGGNVADTGEGTQSINLACTAYESRTNTDDAYESDFAIQSAGVDMWLERCTAYGSLVSIYCPIDSNMYVKRCTYETTDGAGNIVIT